MAAAPLAQAARVLLIYRVILESRVRIATCLLLGWTADCCRQACVGPASMSGTAIVLAWRGLAPRRILRACRALLVSGLPLAPRAKPRSRPLLSYSRLLVGARVLLSLIALTVLGTIAPVASAAQNTAPIQLSRFVGAAGFSPGSFSATTLDADRLALAPDALSGTWTSSAVQPQASFTRLVASWNAETPGASRITVQAQATTSAGETSDWYTLGIWAADDAAVQRTSVSAQSDALGRVATDTLYSRDAPFVTYSLRVRLERASTAEPSPSVGNLSAAVSDFEYSSALSTAAPVSLDPVELPVAPLSREIHARQYPQWGGGGEAWCSPTSTEMVVEFWGRGPTGDDLSWVNPSYADPSVDYAARATYDAAYRGTGNWPFNTAYAARFGLDAFVTQLRSLAEVEQFVRAGIPVVASIASRPGELDGFLFAGGTTGHLVVIVGFDGLGNPIVNDPASLGDSTVRHVYDRAQFERVWLRGSGGTAYIIHPPEVSLPPAPAGMTPNW